MFAECRSAGHEERRAPRGSSLAYGFSTLELVIVLVIVLAVAATAIPSFMNVYYTAQLKSVAGDLAGLMQQARILAEKQNSTCQVLYRVNGNMQEAYVDLNRDGTWQASEPIIPLPGVTPASGAPSGTGGQPTPYVLVGDTGTGGFDNATTLGFTARGLPCDYSNPPTCTTPAAKYFVYYLTKQRPGTLAWGAVVVSKGGRTKSVIWNGAAWQ